MTQTISATLPASTVYVSGTVNDVAVTWTNTGGEIWEAVADRADDDVYRVSMTIVSTTGRTTSAEFTLYYGLLQLITDRTQSDVNRWKELHDKGWDGMTDEEKAEWNTAAMKGAYNYTDLNRVGNAVLYVAGRLEDAGCSVPVSPKIDWTEEDVPTTSSMERYLDDVATIRAALAVLATTPPLPDDMEELTYTEANNIEQILLDVNGLIDNMIAAWFYSGDVYSGEI